MFARMIESGISTLSMMPRGDCNSDGGTPGGDCNDEGHSPSVAIM
jgi:hypothetical protein